MDSLNDSIGKLSFSAAESVLPRPDFGTDGKNSTGGRRVQGISEPLPELQCPAATNRSGPVGVAAFAVSKCANASRIQRKRAQTPTPSKMLRNADLLSRFEMTTVVVVNRR